MNEALQSIEESRKETLRSLKWIVGILLVFTLITIILTVVDMRTDYQHPWIHLVQQLLGSSINIASSVFIFFTGRKYLKGSREREAKQNEFKKTWEEKGYGEYIGFDHKASRKKMIQMYIFLHAVNFLIIFMNLREYII